jgi:hypothetical protein
VLAEAPIGGREVRAGDEAPAAADTIPVVLPKIKTTRSGGDVFQDPEWQPLETVKENDKPAGCCCIIQ